MKKLIESLFVFVFILLSAFLCFNNTIIVKADSNTIEQLSELYTESDEYNYNNTTYNISDYVLNWDGFDIGRGSGYGQRIVQYNNSYRFDDNDIVNIIPKDLFYTIGSYHYIGKEYGFYINTELVSGGYYYRSYVAVYDISYEMIEIRNNYTSCKIELLFNCWYDNYFRAAGNPFGNSIIEGKDRAITFLTVPTLNNDIITLKNIGVSVSLANRDNPNPGDPDYEFKDYVRNELIDNGDFISHQKVIIAPKTMPVENPYDLNWKEKLVMFGCKKIIEATGVLTPLLWLEYLDDFIDEPVILSDRYYADCYYGSGYEQLLINEECVRFSGSLSSSAYSSYEPEFHLGNFFEITTTIDGNINSELRNSMLLNYEISVSINDPKNPNAQTATKTNTFSYSKYMKIMETDELYSVCLDYQTGSIMLYYYSIDSNFLRFIIFSEFSIVITVYDVNENIIQSGTGNLDIVNPGQQVYLVKIEGVPNTKVSISPCKNLSKYLNVSINSLNDVNLQYEKTNLIFCTSNNSNTFYIFHFDCSNLIGDTISIFDIYGNILINDYVVTEANTFLQQILQSNKFYRIEIVKSSSQNKELYLTISNLTISNEFTLGNYSSPISQIINISGNEIKIFRLVVNYEKNYEFILSGTNDFTIKFFDSNNNEFTITSLNNVSQEQCLIGELSVGFYYFILVNSGSSTNTITFNAKSRTTAYLSYNTSNDILLNTYNGVHDYYYINERGPGFHIFKLNGTNIDGTTFTYPANAFKIYTGTPKNSTTLMEKYGYSGYNYFAQNKYNENSFIVCLPRNGYFYLDINVPYYYLASLTIEILPISSEEIDLFDLSVSSNTLLPILNSQIKGDYFEVLEINQAGKFVISASYNGTQTDDILFVLAKKTYNSNTNSYYIDPICVYLMDNVNNSYSLTRILTEGTYYVGYFNKDDTSSFSVSLNRLVTQYGDNALLVDPGTSWNCGSQINIIEMYSSNKSYNSTFITEGFTRIIYMNEPLGLSGSRLDYNWYSSNESIATVTDYGTVLGRNAGTVKIMASLKADPSKVFVKQFTIIEDAGTGYTVVESNYSIRYSETENGTFHLELENVNCPYPWYQYYTWSTYVPWQYDDILVTNDSWGNYTVSGPSSFDLTGQFYIYNTVFITIVVVIHVTVTNN